MTANPATVTSPVAPLGTGVETHAHEPSTRKLPIHLLGRQAPGWWGMVFLIVNEAVLFASLLASNFYLRFNAPQWPPAGIDRPELLLPIIGTILLVSSSVFMARAESGIRRGNQLQLRRGLLISFLLSAGFLVVQLVEYSQEKFTPQTDVYAAIFFAITGLHGMHVLIAVIANAVVQVRASNGYFTSERHLAVQNLGLYSHFVDAVWIFVFLSLYVAVYL